jgi:hypothetical protein
LIAILLGAEKKSHKKIGYKGQNEKAVGSAFRSYWKELPIPADRGPVSEGSGIPNYRINVYRNRAEKEISLMYAQQIFIFVFRKGNTVEI